MKRLDDLRFYGDAYEGANRGDTTEYYQYAIRDGIVYRVVWAYDRAYLDTIESMDDIAFDLQDIYRLESLEDGSLEPEEDEPKKKARKMFTATIQMKNNGEIYTGGTGRGKTIERAIALADGRTANAWSLHMWADVDGERVNYERIYNTKTGKEEIIIL